MILVFDIECNGLLREATRMWILVAKDLETGNMYKYLEGDLGWIDLFNKAKIVIGHNICGYDLRILEKLFNYKLPKKILIRDTLPLSRILDYRRFGFKGHSLEQWGIHFGYPKVAIDDWSTWTPEKEERCVVDVDISAMVYIQLMEELDELRQKKPHITTYIKAEQAVMKWQAIAELKGWPFDKEGGERLFDVLEKELEDITAKLEPRLGIKVIAVDKCKGVVNVKKPKWTKMGFYDSHTAKWFGVDPESGFDDPICERRILGPYCRVRFEPLKLSSPGDVKIFLYRHGWEPTDWNYKREGKKLIRTSPKITEDSLELLGGDGALYKEYTSASSRYSNLKTWLANIDEDGRLHGDSVTIGTPSMRMRHKIIVNVPSVDSPWGKEMRRLFQCPPGWKIVGCDSAGNQARGLAHYIANPEFINVILNEDVHLYNAENIIKVLNEMGAHHNFTPKNLRNRAKRVLYAYLFGGGGPKLWLYVTDKIDTEKGREFKDLFTNSIPGFQNLLGNLKEAFKVNKKKKLEGWIVSIVGNRLYVDSAHKLLVYLLQATEKITCSTALMMTAEKLEEENIPYQPLILMHDEYQFMVPEEYAERACEIGSASFREAPKLYGIKIMDGDGKIGSNWEETH